FFLLLALTLLVLRVVRADHADDALAPDDLALVTNLLDRRSDLHGLLTGSTDDGSAFGVVRGAPHLHAISGPHGHRYPSKLFGDVRRHFIVLQLDLDQTAGKHLPDDPHFQLHARLSTKGPSSVMATECSKWAESLRSFVTAVHLSSRISTSLVPA